MKLNWSQWFWLCYVAESIQFSQCWHTRGMAFSPAQKIDATTTNSEDMGTKLTAVYFQGKSNVYVYSLECSMVHVSWNLL